MKSKINDFIAVFILQLVLTIPFYTISAYGITISNVQVTKVTSNSATIEWDTDVFANGLVRYGKTTALGFGQLHDNYVFNHTITLFNFIDSETTYFFAIESTDLAGNKTVDNNSNNFYTFRTVDITPPPTVTGLRSVSSTSNSIFLTWDAVNITDLSRYIIYESGIPIANSTANFFNATGLIADKQYSFKVSAVDTTGNEGLQSFTLLASTSPVDLTFPIISNIFALPLTDTTARVTWLTNENSTTVVLYGINKTDKTKSSFEVVTNHSIVIDGLAKGIAFTFIVKSCDASNNCAESLNQSFIAGTDLIAPFINVSIPRFVNRRVLDIIGSTEAFSSVTLFVNDMNTPQRSLSGFEVGSSGKFTFSQIQLQDDNTIKLVIVDPSGNRNEATFLVTVDTEEPVVQLDETPSITSKTNFTLTGSVNEQVLIKVFVDANVNSTAIPSKITGLNATRIEQNFVELKWDESQDSDFSHYVVHRQDASPIAITKPADFNFFVDALVDSGRSYTYQVSAVNIFANEGPLSDPLTVTTLLGGAILNLQPAEVDIFEDFRKPVLILNGTGVFNFDVKLSKGDGTYTIKLIFEDLAGNLAVFEREVLLDTKKPDVKIISPPSGAFIFENVANEIDIVGVTEPNARVHLFVDRTPFGLFNASFELSGLTNEVQDVLESDLDAKCRFNVGSNSLCRTGADFSTTADSEGNFKFERVDLTAIFGGAARLREVAPTEFRETQLNPEAQDSKTTTLLVIATDRVGLRGVAAPKIKIGTCWSGNQSWDVIPLTQYQSPAFLSTERMAEGTETVYFYLNYSYIGRGTNAKITGVSISKACGTRETLDPRFNISCQVMPSGNSPRLLNPPDNTVSYSAMPLQIFPRMDTFLENDWKSFMKAINKELTLPLKIRITYKHDTNNDGNLETETQTTCEQVSYVVDNSIIDPRKVLPDWLLFDFVDFLQESIKSLTKLQEQIDKLVDFVAVGCIASWGLNLATGFYRRWVTFWEERTYSVLTKGKFAELIGQIKLTPAEGVQEQECKEIIEKIVNKYGSFKLRYVNDFDLKRCFPASAAVWETEANTYKYLRYSCDRIFGHSSPAAWTETKSDSELYNKISTIEGCAVDQGVRGQPLRAENCKQLVEKNIKYKSTLGEFAPDAKCVLVKDASGEDAFIIGNPVSGNEKLYDLIQPRGTLGLGTTKKYAIKKDETNYFTAQSKSCEELCGVKPQQSSTDTFYFDGYSYTLSQDPKSKIPTEIGFGCTTVDKCRSLNQNINREISDISEKKHKIKSAFTVGYTSSIKKGDNRPCFYNGESASVVSDSPATRQECCCINSEETKLTTRYYNPKDIDLVTSQPVHESKATLGQPAQNYPDMKWSYRYFKEKFEVNNVDIVEIFDVGIGETYPITETSVHKEYHPYRYIEERDYPACFGQNYWFYEQFKPESTLMLNPSRDYFLATLQCAHITGISQRIQFIKNLMTSMSTCLIQVRTTGRGDAGACKELFTQYLCNAIWQVIRFFVDGCTTSEFGAKIDPEDTYGIATSVRAFASSAYGAITDLQQEIRGEYGNAKLNEILGTGEESVARKICLGAFGYDWEINVRNIVDAAYATPFATLVQAITRSREFLTVDPVKFAPKYEYRASWIINPGCDFERYDVQLVCVGRKQLDQYPNQINCGALGAPSIAYTGALGTSVGYSQCDCINLPDEKRGPQVFSGRLKQNVLEDKSFHRVEDSNVRYDHLKFVLRADRKIASNIKPNCFPQGYDSGEFYFPLIDKSPKDIFDCRLDELSGSFFCGQGATFADRKGIAYFTEVKINDVDSSKREELVFSPNEPLAITTTVFKAGKDKCIKVSVDNVAVVAEGVTINGTYQYPLAIPALGLGQRERIVKPSFIEILEKSIVGVQQDFTIEFQFFDTNNNGFIDFFDDEVNLNREGRRKIPESKYYDSDGKLTIDKNGAVIQIVSVAIDKNLDGTPKKTDFLTKVGVAEGVILVRKAQPATIAPSVQVRTITLGLYHLKGDVDSWDGNTDNCNFNDPVLYPDKPQERKIQIKLEERLPKDALAQGPLVKRIISPAPQQKFKKGEPVTIQVEFVNLLQVKDDGVEFSYLGPDRISNKITLNKNIQGIFEGIISTDVLQNAGVFDGKVIATGQNQQKSETPIKFEVQCGGENNVYGFCKQLSQCSEGNYITSGFPCQGAFEDSGLASLTVCCRT